MSLKEQNIMFLTRSMALGGTENVILQLCEILKPEVNKIIVCSCGGINLNKLNEMGIKHFQIIDIENKNPINIIKNYIQIKKIVKSENINIIHSHHRMAALYARVCSNKKNILIANAHNTFKNKKFLTRLAYRNTKIIAVGNQVKNNLVDYFKIPSENVEVIHNAIKPFDNEIKLIDIFNEEKKKGHFLIGNIGRLSEQKGMEYFIEAASMVYKKNKNVRFFIIGTGEELEKLEHMASKLLPREALEFLGYRSDIQNIISQLDLVVLSSLWEGLPLTPIETFSVGKTIIATAVDGTVEIVKNHENGILVHERNAKELAESMIKLIEDEKLRVRLEEAAFKTYNEEFSYSKLKEKYIEYYKNIKYEV